MLDKRVLKLNPDEVLTLSRDIEYLLEINDFK
jgi:hypothetical protein